MVREEDVDEFFHGLEGHLACSAGLHEQLVAQDDWGLRLHIEGGIVEDVDDLVDVLAVHFELLLEEQVVGQYQAAEDVRWAQVYLDQLVLDG
jgi:hypothetical protein